MTRYCKQERTKVYNLYLEDFYHPSQNSYRNYTRAEQDFKDRFHKRFDPRCLIDEYDIWGITWNRKEGKPYYVGHQEIELTENTMFATSQDRMEYSSNKDNILNNNGRK